jgi:hypothetical protein
MKKAPKMTETWCSCHKMTKDDVFNEKCQEWRF